MKRKAACSGRVTKTAPWMLFIGVSLAFLFWGFVCYWKPIYGNSLFEGLLGAMLGVFAALLLAFIAYRQLSDIANTTSTDFIHKLKNDIFVESTRILMDHIIENRLLYREISDRDRQNGESSCSSNPEMGYFEVDEKKILKTCPDTLKEQLLKKRYYLQVEIDDFLLGHLEDIGLFEEKGLIDTDMVYEEFSYYIFETFENQEIKKYIGDADFCLSEFSSNESPQPEEVVIQLFLTIAKEVFGRSVTNPSIKDLNDLLKEADLPNKITKKRKNIRFSDRLNFLLNKTRKQRKKRFSSLNGAAQRNRKSLNRLLLEEAYSSRVPKSDYLRSSDFDSDMYSKFTYIYYKLKDFERKN